MAVRGVWSVLVLVGAGLLMVVPAAAKSDHSAAEARRAYEQAQRQLKETAQQGIERLQRFTKAQLPAVQKLIDAGKLDDARTLAKHDIAILIGMCDGSVRKLNEELRRAQQKLKSLGDSGDAEALGRLVNGELVPAVRNECDGSVRKFKALFGDGSV